MGMDVFYKENIPENHRIHYLTGDIVCQWKPKKMEGLDNYLKC